jgi:Bifunctional DNA primase/polymerase, N-terminal/Primase C terminal 1 (PriCT-1)
MIPPKAGAQPASAARSVFEAARQAQQSAPRPRAEAELSAMGTWAVGYAKNGIPVFPVHNPTGGFCSCGDRNCPTPAKHPRTEHGHKDATTDAAQVATWWRQWPDANIGMPTGAASGRLVMDCDPRNGAPEDRAEIIQRFGPIPEAAEIITGSGGRHLHFQDPGVPIPKILAAGVDLKGDGGYVVVPPSLHMSCNRYDFDGLNGAKAFISIAPAPEWLLKRIAAHGTNAYSKAATATPAEKWAPGERNNKLTSVAGTMQRRGMSREAITAAMLEENRRRCDPPLPDGEVRSIAGSVARYEPPAESNPKATREQTGDACFNLTSLQSLLNEPGEKVTWILDGILPAEGLSQLNASPKQENPPLPAV